MGREQLDPLLRTYVQRIEAPPDRVFPLLCPVREGEWLEDWAQNCTLIHSRSGFAEEGCVFQTRSPGRPVTTWMITRHDPSRHRVEFVRVTEGLVATRLRIKVEPASGEGSSVGIEYVHTPLGEEGRRFLEEHHGETAFLADMAWWEASMNHWLGHGEVLLAASEQP